MSPDFVGSTFRYLLSFVPQDPLAFLDLPAWLSWDDPIFDRRRRAPRAFSFHDGCKLGGVLVQAVAAFFPSQGVPAGSLPKYRCLRYQVGDIKALNPLPPRPRTLPFPQYRQYLLVFRSQV